MAKATDGEPENGVGDDLEAKRAKQALDGDAPPDAVGEDDDGQLFVIEEQGRRVTLGTLYHRGTPVEYRFVLGSKSVPARDAGLIGFQNPDLTLVVPVRAGDVKVSPTYNPDGTVKKITIYAAMKPLDVIDARSERGREALAGAAVPA